ncbi:histidine kinase [Candidatus Magnetoovum chiemensis]|nr:histidine kinase [Candidatus Magnetoovum chiemensis]
MTDYLSLDIFNKQLQFIAKILSLYTHEIKNHLAIINESIGLAGDYIDAGQAKTDAGLEKIEILLKNIEKQIKDSSVFTNFLNSFGHRMDKWESSFNINDALNELIILFNKAAVKKQIEIVKQLDAQSGTIVISPSLLQFIVFSFLTDLLNNLEEKSSITLTTSSDSAAITVSIAAEGVNKQEAIKNSKNETACFLINSQGWKFIKNDSACKYILIIPKADSLK